MWSKGEGGLPRLLEDMKLSGQVFSAQSPDTIVSPPEPATARGDTCAIEGIEDNKGNSGAEMVEGAWTSTSK